MVWRTRFRLHLRLSLWPLTLLLPSRVLLLHLLPPLRLALLLSQPLRLRTYPLELCREFGINARAPGAAETRDRRMTSGERCGRVCGYQRVPLAYSCGSWSPEPTRPTLTTDLTADRFKSTLNRNTAAGRTCRSTRRNGPSSRSSPTRSRCYHRSASRAPA